MSLPRLLVSFCFGLVCSLLCGSALAHGSSQGELVLEHPYATPTAAAATQGAAYLRGIRNRGDQPDRLLRASSPVAARVELERVLRTPAGRSTQVLSAIELAPKAVTSLRHDGQYQLALIALKQPLKNGDRFDLTLHFERAGSHTVKVWVQTPHAH